MREIETRLVELYPQYRRVWVDYCTHRQLRVLITLFPSSGGDYRMVFGEAPDLSFESINNILQKDLVVSI